MNLGWVDGFLGGAAGGCPAQGGDQAVEGGDAGRIAGDSELELATTLGRIRLQVGEVELTNGA